jgi:hypothetical protein
VYFLRRAAARAGAVVVNAEPEESALARVSGPTLRSRIEGPNVSVSPTADGWAADAYTGSSRRPLVTPLLILALLVLVAEAIIARSTGVRAAAPALRAAA